MAHDNILIPDSVSLMRQTHSYFDDFDYYVTADRFTTVATGTGSAAVADGSPSKVAIITQALDNDDTFLKGTIETWLLVEGKTIDFNIRASVTEANTNTANAMFGLINAAATNDLIDDGGGPRADFSGFCFYKLDSSLNWNVVYSDSTTQTKVELTAANSLTGAAIAHVSATMQTFRITVTPKSSTKVDINFFVGDTDEDMELVYRMIDKTYASATDMEELMLIKAGSGHVETLSVDWISVAQPR